MDILTIIFEQLLKQATVVLPASVNVHNSKLHPNKLHQPPSRRRLRSNDDRTEQRRTGFTEEEYVPALEESDATDAPSVKRKKTNGGNVAVFYLNLYCVFKSQ